MKKIITMLALLVATTAQADPMETFIADFQKLYNAQTKENKDKMLVASLMYCHEQATKSPSYRTTFSLCVELQYRLYGL